MTDVAHEHEHSHGWREALAQMRHEAEHYYADHFDWRGHEPPAGWDGPKYFPPAEKWRLDAWLDRDAEGAGTHVTVPTSTGKMRDMHIAGQLVFNVDGQEQRLLAYESHGEDEEGWLFIPFRDATSGAETYGSGRYVDVPPADEGPDAAVYDLDFNLAYNPSCAYSPAYDCPYPPPGNRLDIRVDAGEMVPFPEQH